MTTDPPTPGTHPDELLAGYVDGSLEPAGREEVERHLASCVSCREDVALSRRARAALGALPELDVPAGLTRPVVDAARRSSGRSRLARITTGGAPHRSSRAARVSWSVGAAAAAAVVVVFAWSALHGGGPAEKAALAPATGAATVGAGPEAPSVAVTRQSIDYDAASIQALAARVAKRARSLAPETPLPAASPSGEAAPPVPEPTQPGPATLGSATVPGPTHLPPLPCISRAIGSSSQSGLVQLIQARFEGTPAYIAVYAGSSSPGPSTDLITVWVVSTSGCTVLNYTSTRIS